MAPRAGTARLAEAYATYFNRTWQHFTSHRSTPALLEPAGYPAITRSESAIYIYGPIFAAYQEHGNLTFRALVGRCLDLLLPDRIVETVVHLINYTPGRRAPGHIEILEAPIPLHNVTIRLRRAVPTTRVHSPLAGSHLAFEVAAGIVTVMVPQIDTNAVIVFEDNA